MGCGTVWHRIRGVEWMVGVVWNVWHGLCGVGVCCRCVVLKSVVWVCGDVQRGVWV